MSLHATVAELIQQSAALIRWIDEHLDGIETPAEQRVRFAGGCFVVALEHHRGIVTLIANRHNTTARAVVRPLFEAYIRGQWLLRCATDTQVHRFQTHGIETPFSALIHAIEATDGFDQKVLSDINARYRHALNGYVHTGFEQVVRHQTEASIEPIYDEDEAKEVLTFANLIGCLSTVAIAGIAGKTTLAEAAAEQMSRLWAPPQNPQS